MPSGHQRRGAPLWPRVTLVALMLAAVGAYQLGWLHTPPHDGAGAGASVDGKPLDGREPGASDEETAESSDNEPTSTYVAGETPAAAAPRATAPVPSMETVIRTRRALARGNVRDAARTLDEALAAGVHEEAFDDVTWSAVRAARTPPLVHIVSPRNRATVSDEKITLRGELDTTTDTDELYVAGELIRRGPGHFEHELVLATPGTHRVAIEVRRADRVRLRRQLRLTKLPPPAPMASSAAPANVGAPGRHEHTAATRASAVTVDVSAEQRAAAERLGVPVSFENDVGMRFVLIPPGGGVQGLPAAEARAVAALQARHRAHQKAASNDTARPPEPRLHDESPDPTPRGPTAETRLVSIRRAYYMQVRETTNAQWRRFAGDHHVPNVLRGGSTYRFDHDSQPAVRIRHSEVAGPRFEGRASFTGWLNARTTSTRVDSVILRYALPTEAEWEHACRAGTATARWWGAATADVHVNVADEVSIAALGGLPSNTPDDGYRVCAPVGRYPPNPWGLHDMLGNVAEWTADWFAEPRFHGEEADDPRGPGLGASHVVRGGSWARDVALARAGSRFGLAADARRYDVGFRLVAYIVE